MGYYYPGDGSNAIPYNEPGKPDRTNRINELREQAVEQDKAVIIHRQAGYNGAASANYREAKKLRKEADNLERRS